MNDWNVVVTTREGQHTQARRMLSELGWVDRTHYYGVLVMYVEDVTRFVDELHTKLEQSEPARAAIGHVFPVTETFVFRTPEEFETQARDAALGFVPLLADKSFHVRMHRRGFKGRLESPVEERMLDEVLLGALQSAGRPGRIDFTDPDVIVDVETLDRRGGMAAWSREERARFPFIGLD